MASRNDSSTLCGYLLGDSVDGCCYDGPKVPFALAQRSWGDDVLHERLNADFSVPGESVALLLQAWDRLSTSPDLFLALVPSGHHNGWLPNPRRPSVCTHVRNTPPPNVGDILPDRPARVASALREQESQKPCEFAGSSNEKQAVDPQETNPQVVVNYGFKSGWRDSNSRPLAPQACLALRQKARFSRGFPRF